MDTRETIRQYCSQFKMSGIMAGLDELLKDAEATQPGFLSYTSKLLGIEAATRERNDMTKRLKVAQLPRSSDLEVFDYSQENGISKARLNQLRELTWLDQVYNIMLMGPSGTGKTYLAAGLCHDAIRGGYKAYFRTMDELMHMLKMKEVTKTSRSEYRKLCQASLIVIDDIMLFPIEKKQAVSLFNFINQLYEKTSFIITTNKQPTEWAVLLDDEILATALLDRLLYRCEVIQLAGKSYRLENRKTIFEMNQG